jgi:hypothetical protein
VTSAVTYPFATSRNLPSWPSWFREASKGYVACEPSEELSPVTTVPDDERPISPAEVDDDPGPRPDDDRPLTEDVVGLGVDSDDREVPEPNEPA